MKFISGTAAGDRVPWLNNLLVVVIMLVIGGVWARVMFGGGGEAAVDEQGIADEVQQRLAEHAPEIEAEGRKLAGEIMVPLGQALYREIQRDYPRYLRAIRREGGVLGERLPDILIAAVQQQYRDYLRQHREVLAEEFPEHASEEKLDAMVAEFEQVIDRIVERYYLEEFQREGERTVEYWSRIEPLDLPGPDEPSLETQLFDYLTDWTVLAFADEAQENLANQ